MTSAVMTLDTAPCGETLLITQIADPEMAAMAMRLGFSEGAQVSILSKIPGGPVVIAQSGMDIALGRSLCSSIQVEVVATQQKTVGFTKNATGFFKSFGLLKFRLLKRLES